MTSFLLFSSWEGQNEKLQRCWSERWVRLDSNDSFINFSQLDDVQGGLGRPQCQSTGPYAPPVRPNGTSVAQPDGLSPRWLTFGPRWLIACFGLYLETISRESRPSSNRYPVITRGSAVHRWRSRLSSESYFLFSGEIMPLRQPISSICKQCKWECWQADVLLAPPELYGDFAVMRGREGRYWWQKEKQRNSRACSHPWLLCEPIKSTETGEPCVEAENLLGFPVWRVKPSLISIPVTHDAVTRSAWRKRFSSSLRRRLSGALQHLVHS